MQSRLSFRVYRIWSALCMCINQCSYVRGAESNFGPTIKPNVPYKRKTDPWRLVYMFDQRSYSSPCSFIQGDQKSKLGSKHGDDINHKLLDDTSCTCRGVSQITGIISALVTNHSWVKRVEKHVIFQVPFLASSAVSEHHIRDLTQHWSYLLWDPTCTLCVIHRIWHSHRRKEMVQASDCTLIDSYTLWIVSLDVTWL